VHRCPFPFWPLRFMAPLDIYGVWDIGCTPLSRRLPLCMPLTWVSNCLCSLQRGSWHAVSRQRYNVYGSYLMCGSLLFNWIAWYETHFLKENGPQGEAWIMPFVWGIDAKWSRLQTAEHSQTNETNHEAAQGKWYTNRMHQNVDKPGSTIKGLEATTVLQESIQCGEDIL